MQDYREKESSYESPSSSSSSLYVISEDLPIADPILYNPNRQDSKRSHSPENPPLKFPRTDETLTTTREGDDFEEIDKAEVNSDASTDIIEQESEIFYSGPTENNNNTIFTEENLYKSNNPCDLSDELMYNSCQFCPMHSQKMYPANVDQNRQETLPSQTVHLHMHQFCNCFQSLYPGYRPPIMAPYQVPIPRPYNLQHYQYTQLNLSPYNLPIMPANVAITQSNTPPIIHQIPLDFGPPPRDKRSLEAVEGETANKENTFLNCSLKMPEQELLHCSTNNFTKYLEQGCLLAEKIAIRNQHRPCFKNIQNLCSRTRGEILKPSNTVSNIHSQGIPWATKDFIYAFVRLINCWHMLKGYLDSKDGTLGNIDRELTPEFKASYLAWEKNTRDLAAHMIRTFTNLDNNVSNPSVVTLKPKENPQKLEARIANGKIDANRIPPQEMIETIVLSESSESSSRNDDSEDECRVYMKPGSYNVPKKNGSSSSPSIEFFDTAQNVSVHYKKIGKKKPDIIPTVADQIWQDAQSAVPYFINKMILLPQAENAGKSGEAEQNSVKCSIDLNKLDQGSSIRQWLNTNNFLDNQNGNGEDDALNSPRSPKSVSVHQKDSTPKPKNSKGGESARKETTTSALRTFRKRSDAKKNPRGILEYDNGGLTVKAIVAVENIVKSLEKEEFIKRVLCVSGNNADEGELDTPSSLTAIKRKLNLGKYKYLQEFVRDIRNLLSCSVIYYETLPEMMEQMSSVGEKFEELLNSVFPNLDFSAITGQPDEKVGPVCFKSIKKSNGAGDH